MPWRRGRRRKRRRMIRSLLLAALGITLIPWGWLWQHSTPGTVSVTPRNTGDDADKAWSGFYAAPDLNPELRWLQRPVYPYSVIPGGVQSVAEFREALLRDPVAAAHYARFDISRSRILELRVEKIAYVSYRIKDRVFWTSRKVRLLRGERIITDGVNYARARCGNRVSEIPQGDRSPHEPPAAEMESPSIFANRTVIPAAFIFPPQSAELIPPAAAGSTPPSETTWLAPPPFGFVYGGSPPGAKRTGCPYPLPSPEAPCKPPHPPPTVVPEPGTLLLISTGLGYMALRGRPRRQPPLV